MKKASLCFLIVMFIFLGCVEPGGVAQKQTTNVTYKVQVMGCCMYFTDAKPFARNSYSVDFIDKKTGTEVTLVGCQVVISVYEKK